MPTEKLAFQAETRQLLDLMIHSLYKHKEIFLRELISNASDALDKLRFEALTRPELLEGDEELRIRLEPDAEDRQLVISDNGIGMSRDEVIQNLGTIARSGTREFVQKLKELKKESGELPPELIGQFGVGFYSSFMVADRVVVDTRKAGEKDGCRWTSHGDGEFTVETIEKPDRGTTITLHLKEKGADEEDPAEFTSEWKLRDCVKRYSDFVAWPIEMDVEREEGEGDEKKKVTRSEVLNSRKPIWTRAPSEVTEDEHADFYRHLTHDWEKPLRTIHFRAEGTLEYTALLYVPSHKPLFLMDAQEPKSKLSLYVKRVFIMDDCDELLPPWLRFVRGLVDSNDLPLNVSRETLQHSRQMKPIQKRLVGKTLEALRSLLEKDREAYQGFFGHFGAVLKEGIYYDPEQKEEVAKICLFQSSRDETPTTLEEYVERMPEAQKEIYYIAAPDRRAAAGSPHLEAFRKKGFEVLFLTDPVDEFALQRLTEFDGKALKSIERGEIELDDEQEKEEREAKAKELKPLLDEVRQALDEQVSDVRLSNRLTDSPAVLVTAEHDLTPQMERVLREARQEVPKHKRILELNPTHPVVVRLDKLRAESPTRFRDHCELLFGQAQLAEGSKLEDPARFNRLLSALLGGE